MAENGCEGGGSSGKTHTSSSDDDSGAQQRPLPLFGSIDNVSTNAQKRHSVHNTSESDGSSHKPRFGDSSETDTELLSQRQYSDNEGFQEAINRKLSAYWADEAKIVKEGSDLVLNPQSFKPSTLYKIELNGQGISIAVPSSQFSSVGGSNSSPTRQESTCDIVSLRENLESLLDTQMMQT